MKKIYTLISIILFGFHLNIFAQSFPFIYTGAMQTWVVPPGVTSVGFDVQGAAGGMAGPIGGAISTSTVGNGGRIQGTLTVTPGTTLNIFVGGQGTTGTATGATGGWNGGGNTYTHVGVYSGGSGGGGSDIRIGGVALTDRKVVGSGGGGSGWNSSCPFYGGTSPQPGGDGGGLTGSGVTTCPLAGYTITDATGGDQVAGGLGGWVWSPFGPYSAGSPGVLGAGGSTALPPLDPGIGGGGGGGYYGGGAGCWMGGAGGSSYSDGTLCTAVINTPGYSTGDGTVILCLTDPGVINGAAPICSGKTLLLSETKPGGVWSSSNTLIATVDPTGLVTGKVGGVVTISYTLATPCATVYAVASITVINSPLPIIGSPIICVDGTPMFSDATPAGFWSSSNTAIVTIVSGSGLAKGIYPGSATITYTIPPAGCITTMSVNVVGIGGPHSVCAGSTVTLILPVGGGGAWTSSDTTVAKVDPAGIVSGISIGTSTISYSSALCPESIVMQVNPIAPVIGADSICVAGSAYYTDIVGIGSWSSSNTAVAVVTGIPGLVSGVSPGTAIISFSTPVGCLAQDTVMVIALPPAITGTMHVCVNATTTLHNSLAGGVWSSIDPTIATTNAGGVVTGITPDTTSILYTIRPGCSVGANVVVNPLPLPITGIDTICPGVIDTFHDASRGGLWSSSTATQDTIVDTTGILTSRLSGNGVISYTLPTGCTISKAINIYPVPTPLITYNKFDNTMYTDPIYVAYQWYDSISGKIPHAVSPSLAGVYSEWFYVVVTDTNGCKSPSAKFYFNNTITGVNNTTGIRVKIFPNPATGMLYIESPVRVRAVITGIDGKTELDQSDAKELDISRLASAVYLISLYDDGGAVLTVQKIIKE